jgi:hypothetical protein
MDKRMKLADCSFRKLGGLTTLVAIFTCGALLFATVGLGQSLLVHDIAVKQITDPHGTGASGTYYMQPGTMPIAAIIQNLGGYGESNLTCTAEIAGEYAEDVTGLTLDVGSEQPVTFSNASLVNEGYYTLTVSLPLDGDVNPANSVKNLTIGVDATPPVTTIHFNPPQPNGHNGWYTVVPSFSLSAEDSMSGVKAIYYKLNDGPWIIYTTEVLPIGPYTVCFYAVDTVNNAGGPQSVTPRMDIEPPQITLHKAVGLRGITYTAVVNDSISGPDHVEFYLMDVLQLDDTDGSNGFVFTLSPIPQVDCNVTAIAYDMAGNSASAQQTSSQPSPQQQGSLPRPQAQGYTLLQVILKVIRQLCQT